MAWTPPPVRSPSPRCCRPKLHPGAGAGSGSFDLIWQLGRLASLGLGDIVAETLGIAAVYAIGAVLFVAAAAIGWAGLRAHGA
jgi:hypothetical protein